MNSKVFKIKRVDITEDKMLPHNKAYIEDGKIVYVSRGSSSCPPIIENVEQTGNEIHLTTKDYTGMICTRDLSPVKQIITYDDGTIIPEHVKIFLDGKQQN